MIFSLSVSYFSFHCLRPRPYWMTLTGLIFKNCLRDYGNEYDHFVIKEETVVIKEER